MIRNFILKPIASLSLVLALAACGDNPIDIENEKQAEFSWDYTVALDSLAQELEDIDYYKCYDQTNGIIENNKTRCDNFIDKYFKDCGETALSMTTIIKMVKDTDNYDDKGRFVGEIEDPKINYLLFNKMLNITLTSYKQTVESLNKKEDVIDPEIRFLVKTYIDLEPSEYDPVSALALDTVDIREWEGKKAVTIQLPRGIDGMEICPIFRDKNEHDAYYDDEDLLDESSCIEVKNLGWIEENQTESQKSASDKAEIQWEWYLYSI